MKVDRIWMKLIKTSLADSSSMFIDDKTNYPHFHDGSVYFKSLLFCRISVY